MFKYSRYINTSSDINNTIIIIKSMMESLTFSKSEVQQILVCVSELTKNVLKHSGSYGRFSCYINVDKDVLIKVEDWGIGIRNVDQLLAEQEVKDPKGLGLGLTGSRNLMDHFFIETSEYGTLIFAVKLNNKNK